MTEEKKKRGRPKKVVVETAIEPVKTRVVTANYGSNENRRVCHACGSAKSKIDRVNRFTHLVIRHRKCSDCGRLRTTQEVV